MRQYPTRLNVFELDRLVRLLDESGDRHSGLRKSLDGMRAEAHDDLESDLRWARIEALRIQRIRRERGFERY